MAKITPTLMLSLKGKDNTYPIYFSISLGKGKRKFVNSKIRIKKEEWDLKKKQVIKHPNAVAYNLFIKNRIADFDKEKVLKEDKELYAIFNEKKQSSVLFKTFALEELENSHIKNKYDLKIIIERLCKVPKMDNIAVVNITTDIVLQVQKYLLQKGLKSSTIAQYMHKFAYYMKQAEKKKIIIENPFKESVVIDVLVKGEQAKRTFLNKEEINVLLKNYDELKRVSQIYLGYFLISCFTGLRASDVVTLNLKTIYQEKSISIKTQKTGEQLRIPLTEDILNIIAKMLKNPYHKYRLQNKNYAINIKKISKKLGIKKQVTTHVARHTFAMRLAEMGVSIEVAQRLLGHTDIKTTAIYYKIGNKRINDEMSKFGYS